MKDNKTTYTTSDLGYYSYREIAYILGISILQVKQTERTALAKIRHPNNLKKLHILREYITEASESGLEHKDLVEDF